MNINILAYVTPPSISHACSTWKILFEEKFTLGEFTPVNMKNCGHRNVRKHREIKNGEKYITLDIYLKIGGLYKMNITYSDPKYYFGISVKELITSLGLKTIGRSNRNKKAWYVITNVSMKNLSKISKEFLMLPYNGYV